MLLLQYFTIQCSTCKIIHHKDNFYKNKSRKNGLSSECKDCVKSYQLSNKDRISAYQKNYENDNKDIISERRKNERLNDPEKFRKRSLQYRANNIISIANYKKEYVKTDKGKAVTINTKNKRRAIEKLGNVSSNDLMKLQKTATRCYWCGKELKNKSVNLDHYVPLAKGGEHRLDNFVIACEFCNKSKGSKDPLIFAQSIGKLL